MFDEHLGYIADRNRSARFRQAIARMVRPGDLVVDAGCGFGVLGVMCLEAGAAHVWGIDQTAAIKIARQSMVNAGLSDRYTTIGGSLSRATIPQPVDLIICDHVGYFGVDYGIIAMISDARRRFLKADGQLLPRRIRLKLAGVCSTAARTAAEAWADEAVPQQFRWLRDYGINAKRALTFTPDDIRTSIADLGTIDLREDHEAQLSFKASLTIDRDGWIDGFAGWFECELAPDVWMTNSPLAVERIDRPQIFLAFDQPIAVQSGQGLEATVSIRHEDNLLAWTVRPDGGQRQKYSSWESQILALPERSIHDDCPCQLTAQARARQALYQLVDGCRNSRQICDLMRAEHGDLFPTEQELSQFVRSELARNCE